MRQIEKRRAILSIIFLQIGIAGFSQTYKKGFDFPDAGIYKVLKCDFHTHTVFSDGEMWPTLRVMEAAGEDIDAIAITDHIEYRPHLDDFKTTDHNRSYELAEKRQNVANVLVIHGTEITREMPPGHLNAIFIDNANVFEGFVNKENSRDGKNIIETLEAARVQNAYIFWNHPSFPGPNEIAELYPVHTTLFEKKLVDGIEVINGPKYEAEAFQWCLDYNLAILGTSDVHRILAQDLIDRNMLHRTMTLVLAEERSEKSIREALDDRRTIAIGNHMMYGREEHVRQVFESSVKLRVIGNIEEGIFEFSNESGFPFTLVLTPLENVKRMPRSINLNAHSKAIITLSSKSDKPLFYKGGSLEIQVTNIFTKPNNNLTYQFKF
ncbi:MAG: histidinol-phosphatase [Bacteroidales bacterium]|nr:histidinol-phosphatase [Bacteroidales bacterium]MBN2820968.1 histidinol-phosphatase [Bacteroidales bacterium]